MYRFLDPDTRAIIKSRDVRWLNKFYGEWRFGGEKREKDKEEEVESDDDFEDMIEEEKEKEEEDEKDPEDNAQEETPSKSKRMIRELKSDLNEDIGDDDNNGPIANRLRSKGDSAVIVHEIAQEVHDGMIERDDTEFPFDFTFFVNDKIEKEQDPEERKKLWKSV